MGSVHRILIAAGGRGERWGKYLGVLKPMIQIEGTSLVARAAALVRECASAAELLLVTSDARVHAGSVPIVSAHYSDPECGLDKLCEPYWSPDDRTTVLWGDTYYTEEAMQCMLGAWPTPVRFFGRNLPSSFTGKDGPELYAFSFTSGFVPQLRAAMDECRYLSARGEMGTRLCLWDVYAVVGRQGPLLYQEGSPGAGENRYFTLIHDWTEDFDGPRCYRDWTRLRAAAGFSQQEFRYSPAKPGYRRETVSERPGGAQ